MWYRLLKNYLLILFFLTRFYVYGNECVGCVFVFDSACFESNQIFIFFAVAFLINLLCADFNTI